jgi:hypothetical protein
MRYKVGCPVAWIQWFDMNVRARGTGAQVRAANAAAEDLRMASPDGFPRLLRRHRGRGPVVLVAFSCPLFLLMREIRLGHPGAVRESAASMPA